MIGRVGERTSVLLGLVAGAAGSVLRASTTVVTAVAGSFVLAPQPVMHYRWLYAAAAMLQLVLAAPLLWSARRPAT